jgi:Glycoside hydrolase family 44/Fibronectin type III domain
MVHRTRAAALIPFFGLLLAGCGGGASSGGGGQPGGSQPAPSAPAGLVATPGDQQVALSWTADSGATNYHVKRSATHGGPYTQVAAPTGTSFSDTGLINGTAYYYVVSALNPVGESSNSAEVSAVPAAALTPPPAPTGLKATAGNQQVSLSWTASAGAIGYHVKRSTTSGGPYSQVSAPSATSYADSGLTNGTVYYYVVSALDAAGESANSSQVSVTPTGGSSGSVHITVDVLSDRHAISPYVYGVNFPNNAAYITDSGATLVRWGGNASTRYNWINFDTNAASDWYFGNRAMGSPPLYSDSTQFVANIANAGGFPLMTIGMLPWVAKDDSSYSFSVSKYGAQCQVNPYNSDDGNGLKSDCQTNITGNDPHDAHVALLDTPGNSDPAGSVYRSQWAAALATAFGNSIPHFYDMDNEVDIWGSTHRDVHPNPSAYDELRDVFLTEARGLKTWDPQAIRFGPVSCCWWFYWNGANGNDKAAHAGIDFLPWWLNEIYWHDRVDGTRSLDVFDFHAYPDAPDTSSYTVAQKQALALRIFRDYWDPTYTSESWINGNQYVTQLQPSPYNPFRIPRLRAIVNSIYPGTPVAITEWNAAIAGETDFSTALADADAFGIFGRERVYAAARWTAADPSTPAYQSLKLYRNYDGQHHTFGAISVSATNDSDPNLFSSYAALNQAGTVLTVLMINKDPQNAVTAQITLNGFTPSQVTAHTLSQSAPTSIVASAEAAWSSARTFPAYSATLLVIAGAMAKAPSAEWDLNPDTVMVPAGGSVTLQPKITSTTGSVILTSEQSDSGITVALTQPNLTTTQNGTVTVTAGNTPGFYHYTVTGLDGSGLSQNQAGWIVVGNLAATLTKTGDGQSATRGSTVNLSVTLNPGQSGGTAAGASILFTTDAGTLSNRIVTTDSSGKASVVLTLPSSAGAVHVTAEGPIPLGHPTASFTETAQ